VTAANAAASLVRPTPQQFNPNLPANLPAVTAPVQAGGGVTMPAVPVAPSNAANGIQFTVQPANSSQAVGSTFQASVQISNAVDVFAVPLQVQFNPAVLELVNVDTGTFLGSDGQAVAMAHRDEGNGLVAMSARRPPNTRGVNGSGSVVTMTFKAIAPGDSMISLVKVGASDSKNVNLPAVGSQAVVHVK
jgi:general secretion pathway protein D